MFFAAALVGGDKAIEGREQVGKFSAPAFSVGLTGDRFAGSISSV